MDLINSINISALKRLYQHPLISMSALIFSGSLVSSFFSFLFNLFMSRNLSVHEYGNLTSLVSLITLAIMPAGALLPTVVHFAGTYFAKNEEQKAYGLFFQVGKFALGIGLILLLSAVLLSNQIGTFFHIQDSGLIIICGLIVLISYLGVMNSGFLQAKLSFGFITVSQFLGALVKLILGVLFVLLGYSTTGGMWAFFLSYFVPYVITFYPLRFLFRKQTVKEVIPLKELLGYGMPSAITLFSLTSFITVDTLIVKHFFAPTEAGIYAGLSLLGRIIFFFSAPIGTVMFPLIVQRYSRNESYQSTFLLAASLVFLPSALLTVFYFLFPNFVISASLKNEQYLSGASLLGLMGIYMSLYSLLYLLANFYLSIKKTKVAIPIALGSILQVVLIWFFHENFLQVVMISTGIVLALLFLLLSYLLYLRSYGKTGH